MTAILKWTTRALLAALSSGAVTAASAQGWPTQQIELIVPYSPGTGTDAVARAFASEASKQSGRPWVVLNREGAGGLVGFTALVNAQKNGNTIAFSPASPLTNAPFLVNKMPFQNAQVEPVCQVFENVFAIAVRADSPIVSFADLVQRIRAQPESVNYGTAGKGSAPHLGVVTALSRDKVKVTDVPYKNDGALWGDLLGGRIDFAAVAVATIAGKPARLLAVLSAARLDAFPNVPSIVELGYPLGTPGINGLFLPAGAPREVVSKVEALCKTIDESPDFKANILQMKQVPSYLPANDFKKRIENTYRHNSDLMPTLNITKE